MCVQALQSAAAKHNMRVYAYCFMPDHLHLLVQGGPSSFTPDFVHDFKGKSGLSFKRSSGRDLWQKSYHDRVLRTYEGLLDVARYIAWNPVRGGLVEQPRDYPHLGSLEWNRSALVEP
jgi:putative transposase